MFYHKHKFKMNYFFGSKFSILKQILFNFNMDKDVDMFVKKCFMSDNKRVIKTF